MSLVYLASPYSHPDATVRAARFSAACRVAGELMKAGQCVFSPIAHSHPIEQHFLDAKPEGHDFWLRQDFAILRHASRLVVLMLEGWEASRGVAAEIDFAKTIGVPVEFKKP